ncbi:MAG: PxKF domain-containing protein [Chloroflexota bacterium]|nr:PxKF domain-containing protein [Chloroflexota bacterium]
MSRTTKKLLTTAILGAHVPLRLFVVFGLVLSMFSALVPSAAAATVTSATLSGGAGTVRVGDTLYAKSGASLTLTLVTSGDTQCVELTGAHTATQSSNKGQANWTFPLTANTVSGVQTVTATAYKSGPNKHGDCSAEKNETVTPMAASYTLDNTGPVVTGTLAPAANAAGWNNSDVTIKWTATDPAGVPTPPADQTVTANTVKDGVTKTATAKDALGNEGTGSVTVKLDKDKPTITGSRSPVANVDGWNNTDVTVSFTCADALSGVTSCTAQQTVTAEGENQAVTGTTTDTAGNSGSGSVSGIKIDKTAPTLSGAPTTKPNAAGWYNGDVTIQWLAQDALSGIAPAAMPPATVIGSSGEGLIVSARVVDKAGNATSAVSSPVNIDRVAPLTTAHAPANWNNRDVTVTLTAGDALSGVNATYFKLDGGAPQAGTSVAISAAGTHTLEFWSIDKAGNSEAPKTVQVKIDKTPPTINHTQSPAANNKGWNNTDITVTFTCADDLSGVASCTAPQTVTTEGKDQRVTGTATDTAGNTATDPATVSIDKTAPTISLELNPQSSNPAGWHNDDVTVTFECRDTLSGIDTCSPTQRLGEGANQKVSGTATDAAGNSAEGAITGLNIDKTKPTLTGAATTAPNAAGWYTGDVTIRWTATDALSGIDNAAKPADSTIKGEGDNLSASASVSDLAGNVTTTTKGEIKIDRTAPSTSASVPPPLASGWYAGDVRVTLTTGADLSGVATTYYSVDGGEAQVYTAPFTHTLKGEHTITFWSVDVAGNVEDKTAPGHSITLKLDGTAPTTTISLPKAFATGWYADFVTVAFAASDAESGVAKTYYSVDGGDAQLYDGTFEHTLDGTHTITFWSVDAAGNVEDKAKATNTVEIKVDTSVPTITGSRTPAANGFGWNNTDVTVHFDCIDSQSGVATANCTPDTPVTNEGAGQSVSGTATDNVGKTASTTVGDINIDKTKPTLTGAATTAPNAAGWYKGDVSVKWTGQDGLSGIDPATQPADSTITSEGNNLGAGPVSISDKAGNVGSGSVSGIKIDRTAPTISGKTVNEDGTARNANAAGWFNSAVRVRFACTDALSGVQECASDVVLSTDGANQSASGSATDMADNAGSMTVRGINIDSKAPETSANNKCDGNNGWCKGQTATVVLTAADQAGRSGVKEIHYSINGGPEKVVAGATTEVLVPLAAKSGTATVEYYAVDNAGNAEPKGGVSLKYDNIAPTVTHTVNPDANAAGWNNADVTVHFDAKDDDGGSGVDLTSVTPDVTVSAETPATGQVVGGTATDKAGNTGTDSVTVKLDRTAPTISGGVVSGTKGANGWYTGPVTVRFTCSDALSGIATCPADVMLNTDGANQSATGTAVDKAGNASQPTTVSGINIDSVKPVITLNGIAAGGVYTLGAVPAATCNATDSGSGLAGTCAVTVSGGTANGVGTFTYTATATDQAGNTTTQTGSYKVIYRWDGFLQPINDTAHQVGTSTSIFKAASTVPAKFQLKKADGTLVQATTAPEWLTPAKGSATTATVDETLYSDPATSGSTYRWDSTSQQYVYNWGTAKNQAGYYWRIGVKLDDGQIYHVNLGLR